MQVYHVHHPEPLFLLWLKHLYTQKFLYGDNTLYIRSALFHESGALRARYKQALSMEEARLQVGMYVEATARPLPRLQGLCMPVTSQQQL
jgi:hypothetical protein